MPVDLTAPAKLYLSLRSKVKILESDIKEVKAERDQAEQDLINAFAESDLESITISGDDDEVGQILTPSRGLHPSVPAVDKEEAIEAFRENGHDDVIVTQFQAARLKSWIKEFEEDEDTGMPELPEALKKFVRIFEKWSISCTRATKKRKQQKKKTAAKQSSKTSVKFFVSDNEVEVIELDA